MQQINTNLIYIYTNLTFSEEASNIILNNIINYFDLNFVMLEPEQKSIIPLIEEKSK